ncbi:uncharacterized protein LOC129749028 [Uranotaenia lowii]|uniref:uncharacterized protein LOC129749028 n=1 Tax=Uranotaenia lowii TaxID=190385 RepID=UPI002478F69C|nr:uncharacterized protein LOC129749028 [Uranotaenia lowii]
MNRGVVLLLSCLLVGPSLGRPNVEPIYQRNPLEVTEELISTTNAIPTEKEQPASGTNVPSSSSSSVPVPVTQVTTPAPSAEGLKSQDHNSSPLFKRPDNVLKTKIGTSGYVVSTSTKILTSAGLHRGIGHGNEGKANERPTAFEENLTHTGVAEPISEEELHKELNKATERVQVRVPHTTTPTEGLSTWVLLSGSNMMTSTEPKKELETTTKRAFTTTTTRRPATTQARKPITTARKRATTRPTPVVSDEKKEKINKLMTRIKVAPSQDASKPKPEEQKVDLFPKKAKKPFPLTTVATTTTTSTTTTTEVPSTDMEQSTVNSEELTPEDGAIETSTFLIMEPKDAMFDLPQDRSPSKTPKKKPTRKPAAGAAGATKKKTAIKKKKEDKDSGLIKPNEKKPPAKNKPGTGSQIMNYLSREVMPTVGMGLVGLVITAGLASYFLGTPLTAALRRSDETNRKDDIYYSNFEDYAGPDGQNEEEVFGKLIAGMPDRSYYRNNIRRRISQPVRTGHQYYHAQSYSANKYPQINYRNRPVYGGNPEMYTAVNRNVQAKSHNEFFYNTPPSFFPKSSSTSYVTPESTVFTTSTTTATPLTSAEPNDSASMMMEDISENEHELLPNPAAYTAEHSPEHHAQYVVGVYPDSSVIGGGYPDNSMLDIITSAPVPEHGPRRRKREIISVVSEENDSANEIDHDDYLKYDISETSASPTTVGPDSNESSTSDSEKNDSNPTTTITTTTERPVSWSELVRNTVELKLVMGIDLLQRVTSQFQKYLHGVQTRVEDHFNRTVVHQ